MLFESHRRASRRQASRRQRKRSLGRTTSLLLMASVVVGLVVGTLAEIGPTSRNYYREVDQGYAVLVAPLGQNSNETAMMLDVLLKSGPQMNRQTFFSELEALFSEAFATSSAADVLTAPATASGPARDCRIALDKRADSAKLIKASLEGFAGGRSGIQPISSSSTSGALVKVGSELVSADQSWLQCRSLLLSSPGQPELVDSKWVQDPALWSENSIAAFLADISTSSTLVPNPKVSIISFNTSPTDLSISAGARVLPPQNSLLIRLVVADQGNVDLEGVVVSARLVPRGEAPGAAVTSKVQILSGGTAALDLPALSMAPGTYYSVDMNVIAVGAKASLQVPIVVAPALKSS